MFEDALKIKGKEIPFTLHEDGDSEFEKEIRSCQHEVVQNKEDLREVKGCMIELAKIKLFNPSETRQVN